MAISKSQENQEKETKEESFQFSSFPPPSTYSALQWLLVKEGD
jgi:hypothetical protein